MRHELHYVRADIVVEMLARKQLSQLSSRFQNVTTPYIAYGNAEKILL